MFEVISCVQFFLEWGIVIQKEYFCPGTRFGLRNVWTIYLDELAKLTIIRVKYCVLSGINIAKLVLSKPNLTTAQPQPNLNLVGFEMIITLHTPPP